jgi:choloylglycine hydrolase
MRGITVRTFPKIHFRCFIVTVCLISFTYSSFACTAINLTAKDGTVIAGRTMEWPVDMKWELLAMPKGTPIEISAPIDLNLPATKISSKYAFVGVAPAVLEGAPAFLEGQNEVGLGMSGNFLPEFTEYQSITAEDKQYVSIVNFGRLTLGMYGTVKELRAEIPQYKVWYDPKEVIGSPTPPFLHFVFTDRSGESIIIEFVKGEMVIHDNVANVLTNAPTYDWHLLNVRNHLSLSAESTASVDIDGAKVTEIGQGGGLLGLPADYTPPARFVRATYLRNFATQPAGCSEATQLMGHLLNNVDIPLGVAKTKEDGQMAVDYTQWVAIKDLTHNQLSIANYANRTNYIQIDLNRVFKSNKTMRWMINDLPYPSNDMTSQLLK